MFKTLYAGAGVVFWLLLWSTCWRGASANPVLATGLQGPQCLLLSNQTQYRCFAPGDVSEAERTVRFHALNPSAVVDRISGLSLRQVLVATSTFGLPNGRHGKLNIITYIYGTWIGGLGPPNPAPPTPKFVMVSEDYWPHKYPTKLQLTRPTFQGTENGTPTPTTYGNWGLSTRLFKHVVLDVGSNASKQELIDLGKALVREAHAQAQ